MKKLVWLCFSLLVFTAGFAHAQQTANFKKIIVGVVWVPELKSEVFAVDEMRFNTLELLKSYLEKQHAGSVVVWDPGCVRIGEKPLLDSAKELNEFRLFVEKRRMKFVDMPSG